MKGPVHFFPANDLMDRSIAFMFAVNCQGVFIGHFFIYPPPVVL